MPSCERSSPFAAPLSPGPGKPLPRTCTFSGIHAAGDHRVALALRRDDHSSSAARDAAIERRVERALEHHLAQPWLEHAERLEDVRHACDPAPRGGAGGDRVAEAEDVHDVGTAQTRERDRERRRDPHPAIAKRRARGSGRSRRRLTSTAEREAGRCSRSRIVVVITSTSCPCATRRRTSSPAATTGPPNARDGAQTGAAKRIRSGR